MYLVNISVPCELQCTSKNVEKIFELDTVTGVRVARVETVDRRQRANLLHEFWIIEGLCHVCLVTGLPRMLLHALDNS